MQMTGAINDMSILASYDLMSKWRSGSMAMELVDWDGDEVLVMDGEIRGTKNASGLVSWKGRKVISFSRSLDELTDSLEDAMASYSYKYLEGDLFGDDDIPDDDDDDDLGVESTANRISRWLVVEATNDDDDLGLDSIADRTKTSLSVGSTRTFLEW